MVFSTQENVPHLILLHLKYPSMELCWIEKHHKGKFVMTGVGSPTYLLRNGHEIRTFGTRIKKPVTA